MEGLIDYAGLFPPAELPLNEAINEYILQLKSENSKMLSRFIIHTSKLENLDSLGLNLEGSTLLKILRLKRFEEMSIY